jgi:uncharacterized protein (TIGR01777 family)
MNFTLTGATGFLGRRLIHRLLADGHNLHVLGRSRKEDLPSQVAFSFWDAMLEEPPQQAVSGADAIINLAGEPVGQRWTEDVKRRIRESRVKGTANLAGAIRKAKYPPKVLVTASASGYYGDRGDDVLIETSAPGTGFLADVCVDWEKQALAVEAAAVRVAIVRIGIVLGKEGGALKQMLTPFKARVGGTLGSGQQWMSWIHVDDLVNLFVNAAMGEALSGPVNGVAPEAVRNVEFTRELASVLHRPAIFPVPKFALSLMFGEMAEVILSSQRVRPEAATSAGFQFAFPALRPALENLLR